MERRTFETPLGEVWLWGSAEAFDGSRAVVLMLQGVFGNQGQRYLPLEEKLGASVLIGNLPGFDCPPLSTTSIGAFAAAYSHAAMAAFRGRRGLVCGESMGGVLALAMSVPRAHRVALDPPLRTAKMWPMFDLFRARLSEDPGYADFLWQVCGVAADRVEDRDYTHLLARPARIIVGSEPLFPVRQVAESPSLVDEPERALMLRAPHIWLSIAEGAGHILPPAGAPHLIGALRYLLGGAQQNDQDPARASGAGRSAGIASRAPPEGASG